MILFLFVEMIFAFIVYFFAGDLTGKIWPCFNAELIKKILHFSIPIGLASVVSTLSIELDKLIIGKLFNTEQLAIYTNAAREMPVTIISSSLTAVLMPQIIKLLQKNKNKEAINLWGNATTISYVFICFIATSLFVYAPEVISLLYSDKYLPGVQVFRVYSIVLLLRCTYFGMILNSIGKTKFVFYSSLATLAINVVFSYIFYLLFGFIGPAIATLISIAVVAVAQLIATSHSMNTRFKNILPWNNIGYITIINIFLGILFFYVKKFVMLEIITSKIIESIIGGIIWGGLYIIIMFKLIKNKWNSLNENHY
jgi:O-antigen/teichoic acid export membrane protein